MGLCMGFSLLSAIEVVYWFLVRWGILVFKRKKQEQDTRNVVHPTPNKDLVDANIRQTTSKVFDEIFKQSKGAVE